MRALAKLIRQYRSYICGKGRRRPPREPPSPRDPNDLTESIQPHLQVCLEQALKKVIENRFQYWSGKDALKAERFLESLESFHCQGLATGEIAQQWGWTQSKVSRFLELIPFRADVRRQTLVLLTTRLKQLDTATRSPDELLAADQRLSDLLEPFLDEVIRDAAREASTSKNRRMNSQFSQTLCQVMKTRKEEL